VKKVQVACILSIVALFLGWLPKLGADRTFWYLDNDFAHYYLTGSLVRSGINPYAVNLSPLYAEQGFTPTRDIPQAGAPPALAVLMAPFSALSPAPAFFAWSAVQVGSLVFGVLLLLRHCQVTLSSRATLGVVLAAIAPLGMFAHLRYGQSQALIFGLAAAGIVLLSHASTVSWRIGAFLCGVSASLKLFTAPLGFVVARYRGCEGLGWFLAGFISLWGVFVGICGWDALRHFFTSTLPYIRDLSVAFNGNISLSGAITYSYRILTGADLIAVTRVQGLCLMLFIPYLLWERRERRDLVGSSMMMLVACCLLSPTSWPHYLPLVTGGFIYLLRAIQVSARPSVSLGIVLAAYLCTSVAMGYLPQGDIVMRLVSAWWGPLCLIAILSLMTAARRERGVFRR
jgi:hypothetical protein